MFSLHFISYKAAILQKMFQKISCNSLRQFYKTTLDSFGMKRFRFSENVNVTNLDLTVD